MSCEKPHLVLMITMCLRAWIMISFMTVGSQGLLFCQRSGVSSKCVSTVCRDLMLKILWRMWSMTDNHPMSIAGVL